MGKQDTHSSVAEVERQESIRSRCGHPSGRYVEFQERWVEQSIPARFEAQARAHADRVAVKTAERRLTYEELNRAANRIARAIHELRGFDEEPVAVLLAKEAALFPAIIGALKARKIYVPLDPALPLQRLSFIVQDARPGLLITDSKHLVQAEQLAGEGCRLMNLDEVDTDGPDEDLGAPCPPEASAWILYTSGSTGKPKGVVQTHRNVLHYVMNYTNYFHLSAEDRLTFLFPFSVNGAAHDTFAALLNGATLLPFDVNRDGIHTLADWLHREEITIYCSVPTLFRRFVKTLSGEERFSKLRLVRLIGEPVYKKDVLSYQKYFPRECVLVNRLGSTETGSMLFYFIDKETEVENHNVPVGFPVYENEILLLGEATSLDNGDDFGEIAVKSRYLSPGYWRRTDLTARAFLPVPGGSERIYKTGDLGQRLPDGRVVCLGRKDFQVKIRGYRIELSEIEITLQELDEVSEAVVMVRERQSDERMLVAYVVPDSGASPTVTTLRAALEKTLPSHMMPSRFVMVDSLPQAPNGKVDRRALPEPGRARPNLDNPLVPAGTPVEEIVSGIWAKVLDLDEVGIHDSFLELGGDSLLATQVLSRVRDALQVDLSLEKFFRSSTVAKTALAVVESLLGSEESPEDLRSDEGAGTQRLGPTMDLGANQQTLSGKVAGKSRRKDRTVRI